MVRAPADRSARWTWWAAASGLALLAASQWLHAPRVEYVVATLVATAASVAALTLVRGAQRWWAAACSLLLAAATALAIPAEIDLWRVNHDWVAWRQRSAESGLARLRSALDHALADASAEATRALDAPRDRAAAFEALASLDRDGRRDERGVILFNPDTAFAWAGLTRAHVETTRDGVGVAGTPFYLTLTSTAWRADRRATSVALIDAVPPADRLSSPLAPRIARDAGLAAFLFEPPSDSAAGPELMHYTHAGVHLFDVRSAPLVQSTVAFRIVERVRVRAGLAFILALVCFIIGVWRGTRTLSERLAALAVGLACTALVPLSQYSNLTRLFDPGVYFTRAGGPLTGNAGALATTGALVLLGILAVVRRRGRPVARWVAAATVFLVAGLGPFLLRELARGIQIPAHGVDASLWLIWEVPLFLAAVSVLLAGAGAGAIVLGRSRGLPPFVAPVAAATAAILAPIVWEAPGQWPWWYTFLWIGAIAMLALSRRTRFVVLSAATVAAVGATTLVWGRTARGRVALAENDLAGLSEVDPNVRSFLSRFGESLRDDAAPATRRDLLKQYVVSEIAAAGNPTSLSAWPTDSGPVAIFETAPIPLPRERVAQLVARARSTRTAQIETVPTDLTLELVLAAPGADSGVTAVVVAPRSRLFDVDPFSRLLGLDVDTDNEPPYTLRLREPTARDPTGSAVWRREVNQLHGDRVVRTGTRDALAHVEIELRSLNALVPRGALIVLLDLALVGMLWFVSVVADGGAGRWLRARRRTWGRSYRARISVALFVFFVIPATSFGVWSYGRIATDASRSRALLVNETLRSVAPPLDTAAWLTAESDRLDSPLFLYRQGELRTASDPLFEQLAPIGRLVDPAVEVALSVRDEESVTRTKRVDGSTTLFGYRSFEGPRERFILSAPARADELSLGRGRRDLGILVLFATAVGALAALWLSGIAARELARPIGTLREAALSIAAGERLPPLEGEPTVEFRPVFTAFRRMAADLNASRTALEEAQRRTAAVLRNVASGVLALDTKGAVSLANPRAEALLERPLPAGTPFANAAPERLAELVSDFLSSADEDAEFDLEIDQRQLRGRLTRLARGGAVVTLDDITDLARAQRVLAWGEMARQIAHEIKNPLTPIRLGVQHLRRARADTRVDFDRVLEHNVNQILGEIDRLDEIARAFSRYGSAPEDRPAAVPTDVAAVVREVVALERMGESEAAGSTVEWIERGVESPRRALARTDELKEVLLNVLENARHAGATRVHVDVDGDASDDGNEVAIAVRDNGHGIPADVMPRIFEPHFSTRTSGSGLGLAISRQIVEGWGGGIAVQSAAGSGTIVTIRLKSAGGRGTGMTVSPSPVSPF